MESLSLDIYKKRFNKKSEPVWLFIHGGNWNSGNKNQYNLMGRNMAAKGMVAVIIDYTLSPEANYKQMAFESAKSVAWVKNNIKKYGGDPDRIFVSGHSAGGHLASLISTDNGYFDSLGMPNPIKGTILIDAAGLNMYGYLQKEKPGKGDSYAHTFGLQETVWKDASPLFHLNRSTPPMMLLIGEETYPSIVASTEDFKVGLKKFAPETPIIVQRNKKHIPMVLQFFNPFNKQIRRIGNFIDNTEGRSISSSSSTIEAK